MTNLGPAAWIALGYFVAAIPVGLIVGKLRGVDLREVGSGNIGTTNAVRALGPVLGALVFLLDLAKAGAPLWFASRDPSVAQAAPLAGVEGGWLALVGLACVLGHIYPIYLGFRGGKGVACALGILLVVHWPTTLLALLIYAQTIWLVRVSAVASLTALSSAFAAMFLAQRPLAELILVGFMTAIIWWRHRENLRELPTKLIEAGRKRRQGPTDPANEDPA